MSNNRGDFVLLEENLLSRFGVTVPFLLQRFQPMQQLLLSTHRSSLTMVF